MAKGLRLLSLNLPNIILPIPIPTINTAITEEMAYTVESSARLR